MFENDGTLMISLKVLKAFSSFSLFFHFDNEQGCRLKNMKGNIRRSLQNIQFSSCFIIIFRYEYKSDCLVFASCFYLSIHLANRYTFPKIIFHIPTTYTDFQSLTQVKKKNMTNKNMTNTKNMTNAKKLQNCNLFVIVLPKIIPISISIT